MKDVSLEVIIRTNTDPRWVLNELIQRKKLSPELILGAEAGMVFRRHQSFGRKRSDAEYADVTDDSSLHL